METTLELAGVFAFGASGALMAIRRNFDAVGICVLAVITAIGGGVLRDVLLGVSPPAAFSEWPYLAVPLAAAALAFFAHPALERLMGLLLVFDAAGLGLFCVTGTVKALDHDLDLLPAVALGVTTAVGGGVLRDVIARETPALVRPDSELYAVPAVAGALVVALAWELGAYVPLLGAAAAALVFVVRVLALRRGWGAPTAWRGGSPDGRAGGRPPEPAG